MRHVMYDNEEQKRIMQAPYRKLAAVEELQDSNALLDLYVKLYKKKFRGEPIFPVSKAHLTQIKDFRKNAGDKAYELLQHYFEMKDEWFIKQAYSLDCLLRKIHIVAASYSQKVGKEQVPAGKERVIEFNCDSCWRPFMLPTSFKHDPDKQVRCPECERENKAPKRVTKEERARALGLCNNFVVDVPAKKV